MGDISVGAVLPAAEQAKMPLENYRGIQRWIAELRAAPGWRKASLVGK
ncbi:MAG TPA: hypothetical protein VGB91_08380 [Rhizomicrobium sp.]